VKVERFLYGLIGDKIYLLKTDDVNDILSPKNLEILRNLTEEDSDKYLWLPTEQLIALPHIIKVSDDNGRTWVQNQTLLITIHDYLQFTDPHHLFKKYFLPRLTHLPEKFEPLEIK